MIVDEMDVDKLSILYNQGNGRVSQSKLAEYAIVAQKLVKR